MLTVTESAQNKIVELLTEENDPTMRLRMFVQGGGCAGFSYGFTFDNEKAEDDFEITAGTTEVLVDSMSMQYVQGATIDYVENLMGAQFKINNPNASGSCGCGSSFSL
jgi:iron-sulfur cluster insertion protein